MLVKNDLLVENNNDIVDTIKKVVYRFSEKVITSSNGDLAAGEVEKVKYLVNNVVENHAISGDERLENFSKVKISDLEGINKILKYKHGSALSMICRTENCSSDIDEVVRLYVNEATLFNNDMKNIVKPTLAKLINMFNEEKTKKLVHSGTNYKLVLVNNVDAFDYLEEQKKLYFTGDGSLPLSMKLSFPLPSDLKDIRDLFKTGDDEIDSMCESLLIKKTDEELYEFWNKYLINVSKENTNLSSLYNVHFRKAEELTLLMLASRAIANNNVILVNSVELLEKFKDSLMEYTNSIIVRYQSFLNINRDTRLILDNYKDNNILNIYVSEIVYYQYLEAQGDIDAIIGYSIKANKETLPRLIDMETVLSDKEKLSLYYTTQVNLEKISDVNANTVAVTSLWYSFVTRIYHELEAVNKDTNIVKFDAYSRDKFVKDYLNILSKEEVMNTGRVILTIIRLINPEVYEFIANMESVSKGVNGTPENLAKEAALYATIIRLTELLMNDTYVSNIVVTPTR